MKFDFFSYNFSGNLWGRWKQYVVVVVVVVVVFVVVNVLLYFVTVIKYGRIG